MATDQATTARALEMNATAYFYMPAVSLNDEGVLHKYRASIVKCQIFAIGLRPSVTLQDVRQNGNKMTTVFSVLGQEHAPEWPIPPGATVQKEKSAWTLVTADGKRMFPDTESMMHRLHDECVKLDFNVLYVGQVFGGPGARHAVEQLRRSNLIARAAAQVPEGYRLEVLLLEMAGRPDAKVEADDSEMITFCEAALIKYFRPPFNRQGDAYPSTKPRMLQGCADRNVDSIHVRIAFEELPFRLFSETVAPGIVHDALVPLADAESRQAFFE